MLYIEEFKASILVYTVVSFIKSKAYFAIAIADVKAVYKSQLLTIIVSLSYESIF
jgi:hypothetical protein